MVRIINSLISMMILFSIHVLPASAVVAANENLSFDVDGIFYEDRENLKLLVEVSDGIDLADVGFRFVIMPDHLEIT